MKSFARFKIEAWCVDLACVDKIAKEKKSIIFLLIRQDLFYRTVDAKETKRKDS